MMSSRASRASALTISTTCCCATPSRPTRVSGGIEPSPIEARSSAVWLSIALRSTSPRRRGSRPRQTFSATVRSGSRVSSWWTMPIPACWASRGLRKVCGAPANSTVPSSGWWTPDTTFMSVDLPAPFSPTTACTSPGRTWRSTPSSTRTPRNDLPMPRRASSGDGSRPDIVETSAFASSGRITANFRRPRWRHRGPEGKCLDQHLAIPPDIAAGYSPFELLNADPRSVGSD